MKRTYYIITLICILLMFGSKAIAQNPIIRNQFSADPSVRVFNGQVFLFPSHDILAKPGQGRPNWFCMEDYHVFSSANLTDWTDHGVVVRQNNVKWADSTAYSMWAPDCIARNGTYYFYFPATAIEGINGKGFSIGVATANKPDGPYTPEPEPIKQVHGIDPNVFIDHDGQAYLYWAQGSIFVAKLKENMLELASNPSVVEALPKTGLIEGPYLFERKGIYYMTYPHVQHNIERLEYAIGDNPMGPFKYAGVIMDESPMHCWTNHQSFVEFNGQWYLFYHQNALSPKFDKNRSVCIDSLFFNADGTIQKVLPTLRGVGLTKASQKIEIDRYSNKSPTGSSIAFIDSSDAFKGWKALLNSPNAWMQYNAVDFKKPMLKRVQAKVRSSKGGILQLRLDKPDGPVLSEITLPGEHEWKTITAAVRNCPHGIHNLVVVLKKGHPIEIDWVTFY